MLVGNGADISDLRFASKWYVKGPEQSVPSLQKILMDDAGKNNYPVTTFVLDLPLPLRPCPADRYVSKEDLRWNQCLCVLTDDDAKENRVLDQAVSTFNSKEQKRRKRMFPVEIDFSLYEGLNEWGVIRKELVREKIKLHNQYFVWQKRAKLQALNQRLNALQSGEMGLNPWMAMYPLPPIKKFFKKAKISRFNIDELIQNQDKFNFQTGDCVS